MCLCVADVGEKPKGPKLQPGVSSFSFEGDGSSGGDNLNRDRCCFDLRSRKNHAQRVRFLLAAAREEEEGLSLPVLNRRVPRVVKDSNLVDPASSHTLVSKIKPCMSKYKQLYSETANGSLYQL